MKRILSQCYKELMQFKRDRLTLALAFILPLMTLFIFGFAIRLEAKNIPVAVQDFDRSNLSYNYADRLFAANQFVPAQWSGGNPAHDALDKGVAKAAVIIPPDFSRRIKDGKIATVQVLVDGTDTNNARVIKNGIAATTNFFAQSAGLQVREQNQSSSSTPSIFPSASADTDTTTASSQPAPRPSSTSTDSSQIQTSTSTNAPPTSSDLGTIDSGGTDANAGQSRSGPVGRLSNGTITAHTRLLFNPGRKESLYIVPGVYAVILWIYPSLLTAIAMVREKEKGTILQVYASSLTATELLLGKALAYLLVGLSEAVVVIGLGCLIFQVGFAGDPTPLLIGTPLYVAASVMFGLMLGVRTNEQNAAVQGVSTVGFLTALLLSGFIYPLSNIPFPLSLVSNVVPARYFIVVTRDAFVRGAGWPSVWFDLVMVTVIGLFFFNVARRVLSRMQLPD